MLHRGWLRSATRADLLRARRRQQRLLLAGGLSPGVCVAERSVTWL